MEMEPGDDMDMDTETEILIHVVDPVDQDSETMTNDPIESESICPRTTAPVLDMVTSDYEETEIIRIPVPKSSDLDLPQSILIVSNENDTDPEAPVDLAPEPETTSEYEIRKRLIAQVQKYPNIWKFGHPNYRHWGLVQEAWEQISSKVSMPLEECRQIWNGIRSRYTANRNSSNKTKSRLRYFNDLQFLEENFENKRLDLMERERFDEDFFEDNEFEHQSEPIDDYSFNDNFSQGHFVSQVKNVTEHNPESRRLLLEQLHNYDRTKKQCVLCYGKKTFETVKLIRNRNTKKTQNFMDNWKRSGAVALCKLIGLDAENFVEFFSESFYCDNCYELILDLEFWTKSLKSLQLKLEWAKQEIEEKILSCGSKEARAESSIAEAEAQVQNHVSICKSEPIIPSSEPNSPQVDGQISGSDETKETAQLTKKIRKWKKEKKTKVETTKRSSEIRTRSGRLVIKRELSSDSGEDEESAIEPDEIKASDFIIPDFVVSSKRKKRRRLNGNRRQKSKPKSIPRLFCQEPSCTFSSRTEFLLSVHVNKDHKNDPLPFHCDDQDCSLKFDSLDHLNIHKVQFHGSTPTNSKAAPCQHCGKVFSTSGGLKQHLKVNHSAYQLKPKCEFCSKSFETGDEVAEHEELHNHQIVNRYVCVLCEFSQFQTQLDLQRHVQTEHEPELFKCIPCDIVFLTEMRLKSHRYIHHSGKAKISLKCNICGFQAKTPSGLKDHNQKHGLNVHQCQEPGCTASYKWKSALKRHTQSAHTKEKPWECPLCGKSFYTASDLRRHEVYHLDLRPFMCESCPSQFKQHKHLQRHMKLHEKSGTENIKPQTPRRGRLKTYLAQAQDSLTSEIPEIEVEVPIGLGEHEQDDEPEHEEIVEVIEEVEEDPEIEGEQVIIPITMDESNGTFTATTVEGIPVTITYADYGNIITFKEDEIS